MEKYLVSKCCICGRIGQVSAGEYYKTKQIRPLAWVVRQVQTSDFSHNEYEFCPKCNNEFVHTSEQFLADYVKKFQVLNDTDSAQ